MEGQPSRPPGLLRTLLTALRGHKVDLTTAPLGQAILMLAVPMVLEMVVQSIFGVVDIYFVSFLGAEAVTAVGITEALISMVFTVAIGLSIGVTAVVARRIGEGNRDAAGHAAAQTIILGMLVSTVIAVFGATNAPALLRLMGAGEEAIAIGGTYTAIMLGSNAVILLLFLMNGAFRGAGDAAIAMRVLTFGNIINIILDPCLIFGLGPFPELGVTGAAVATTIGRGLAVIYQLTLLFRGTGALGVRLRHFAWDPTLLLRVVRLSGTGMFQNFVGAFSWVLVMRILAEFGSEAVAGYTIAIRVILFAILPAWGLSNAAATLVGQALGAGKPDRAERSAWMAARYNLVFLGVLGAVFVFLPEIVLAPFQADETTRGFAVASLRVISMGFFFFAYGMVLTAAFNGAGDPWTPTWINVGCFWFFELPLAWFLAHSLGFGPPGVWWAITIAFCAVAVTATLLFRRGRWKLAQV